MASADVETGSGSSFIAPPSSTDPAVPTDSGSASASATPPQPSGSALPGSCSGAVDCDDGIYCNGAEQCVDGSCQPGSAVTCRDTVDCTFDVCDESLGGCAFMPDHTACDPELPLCDPEAGCSITPCESAADCDDGVVCNGQELCNADTGSCEAGEPIVCDDGVDCTQDACSEALGECDFVRNSALCDDGNWCNGAERCRASGCEPGTPPDLDDGIACTRDTCNELGDEVVHISNNVTLTIDGPSQGFGMVALGALGCWTPPCTFSMECLSTIDLEAWTSQTNGYGFSGWSGGGCSGVQPCRVEFLDDVTVNAEFSPANVAFTTSTTYTGDLGGMAGADAACQARASAGGLPGTFRAWLSTSTRDPANRLGQAQGWVRPDGRPFANTPLQIEVGELYYPLMLDEFGGVVPDHEVRTGAGGSAGPEYTCQDWTAATPEFATFGYNYAVGSVFQNIGGAQCSAQSPLYCFQVDHAVAVHPVHDYGRTAFVTLSDFLPGGGIAAADDLCQTEASAAGLSGTYAALLATSTASAASRFDLNGLAWVRPDGIRLTEYADQLFSADHWDTAPNVSADGYVYFGNYGTWSGGTSLTSPGTLGNTCQDWTAINSSSSGTGGRIPYSQVQARQFSDVINCYTGYKLTCLEQ